MERSPKANSCIASLAINKVSLWTAVGAGPLEDGEMAAGSCRRTSAAIPGTAVGAGPLEDGEMAVGSRRITSGAIPGAAVGAGPLEDGETAVASCLITSGAIPGTAVGAGPLEDGEMAAGSRTSGAIPGTAVGAGPLEDGEMAAGSCRKTSAAIPGTAVGAGPLEDVVIFIIRQHLGKVVQNHARVLLVVDKVLVLHEFGHPAGEIAQKRNQPWLYPPLGPRPFSAFRFRCGRAPRPPTAGSAVLSPWPAAVPPATRACTRPGPPVCDPRWTAGRSNVRAPSARGSAPL